MPALGDDIVVAVARIFYTTHVVHARHPLEPQTADTAAITAGGVGWLRREKAQKQQPTTRTCVRKQAPSGQHFSPHRINQRPPTKVEEVRTL